MFFISPHLYHPSRREKSKNGNSADIKVDQIEERRGVWYTKGKAEQFNGTAITYYTDGSKKSEYPYVNGKKHGMWIMYRRDGSRSSETVYENDKKISKKE
jgi:antitoxin component YwqK of YwqJK toxin-antitoxin module